MVADIIIQYIRQTLPEEVGTSLEDQLSNLENGDFKALLQSPEAKLLLGETQNDSLNETYFDDFPTWSDYVFRRLGILLSLNQEERKPAYRQHHFFLIGLSAFYAFLQSNVTGPPLDFSLLPARDEAEKKRATAIRKSLISSLSLDGEAAYRLTPNVELLCLAETILTCPPIVKNVKAIDWARLRVDFWHQKLLSESSPTLQKALFERLDSVEDDLKREGSAEMRVALLLERAAVHTHHGFDKLAREDLERAAKERGFEFALTGRLGKRTKYQVKDTSQLVVLARSATDGEVKPVGGAVGVRPAGTNAQGPENLDLNDDTLLESISFTKNHETGQNPKVVEDESLPAGLKDIDPDHQTLLAPWDSMILLALASSITNTSPVDGLTREETLPYATRVLEGGSSNWQVYTQALLVRSRVEGYKSRTVERGLLQLQVVVDQVIAETTTGKSVDIQENQSSTFLPRQKDSESAPVNERLAYVCQLSSPTRWELEAELASRWVSLGGLKTALEIYERLEMWAEAALCWAATDREDKAKLIVKRQLFHATDGTNDDDVDSDTEKWEGTPRDPPPSDAPRLYCIIGDIDKDPTMYEKAWQVSNSRYARAQRSLGRHYFSERDYSKSAHAYALSLKVNQISQSSWFALGCALLELQEYTRAAEAFSRTVQLDDTDAEAWSNLAAALIHIDPKDTSDSNGTVLSSNATAAADGDDTATSASSSHPIDPQQHRREALKALKRASALKYDNHRIWENVLTAALSLSPPSYPDIVSSLSHLLTLRGPTVGETAIDASILETLVRHIIAEDTETGGTGYDANKPGLARLVVKLVDEKVVPLITSSARLWKVVSKLALWRNKPSTALEAEEKAWRCVVSQPGWEVGTEAGWDGVVDATVDLVDAYESLGERERTDGWERLKGVLEGLKGER